MTKIKVILQELHKYAKISGKWLKFDPLRQKNHKFAISQDYHYSHILEDT